MKTSKHNVVSRTCALLLIAFSLSSCQGLFCSSIQREVDRFNLDLKNKQSKIDELNLDLKNKQSKIDELQKKIENLQSDKTSTQEQIQTTAANLKVVSTCLEGVVEAMNNSQSNPGGAVMQLSAVARECKESEKIIQKQTKN